MEPETKLRRVIKLGVVLLYMAYTGWLLVCQTGEAAIPQSTEKTICQLQGPYFRSLYEGQTVQTQGVVYADLDEMVRRGFYLVDEACDADPNTSDGIFVYLSVEGNAVSIGQRVQVSGIVQEFFGMTELVAAAENVVVLAADEPLPEPVILEPPFDNQSAESYLEAHEGMYVALNTVQVVGPTDADGCSWVVDAGRELERVFQDDPRGTGEIVCLGDSGVSVVKPDLKVGDQVAGIRGALDDSLGAYCLQLTEMPGVYQATELAPLPPPPDSDPPVIRLATFNLANLFDPLDDPLKDDTVLSTAEFQRRLEKRARAIQGPLGQPDLLAVQEVENPDVLIALLARQEITNGYEIIWVDAPDKRGMDTALLYRPDHIQVLVHTAHQGCTGLQDGLGPDGNLDMEAPANLITCDRNGDGLLDGNRLFSRPPLAVLVRMCLQDCREAWIVVNHWKSKIEDRPTLPYTQPRRVEQSQFVAGLAQSLSQAHPGSCLVLLGDLNDFPSSEPLSILYKAGFSDLTAHLPVERRYTYNYRGVSQVLDYVLLANPIRIGVAQVNTAPINADFPLVFSTVADTYYRSSDHDPLLVDLILFTKQIYLPWVDIP